MKVLINHLGYDRKGSKKAVVQCMTGEKAEHFSVCDANGTEVLSGTIEKAVAVDNWKQGTFATLDFSDVAEDGQYQIAVTGNIGSVKSDWFEVSTRLCTMRMLNATGYYFKAQRASGEWLYADRNLAFSGEREGNVDAHGGWYDATGDYGIHLSHLSHGSYHNPQQASLSTWAFFVCAEWMEESGNTEYSMLRRRYLDEGMFGADFLMRMRAPSGSFFRSINRKYAFDPVIGTRKIGFEYHGSSSQFSEKAATADQETVSDENYETSLRSGGGTAIAALAIASRFYYPGTDYTREEYLLAAKAAWDYLMKNHLRYTNDGKENLVDAYCALLAATELYKASYEIGYLLAADAWAEKLMSYVVETDEEYAYLEVAKGVSYFHASDEGLPILALCAYGKLHGAKLAENAKLCVEKLMRGKLDMTYDGENPFGYAKYLLRKEGVDEVRFFFPHDTSVAPWWQGENARLASLSTAARLVAEETEDAAFRRQLKQFADDQLNWIMGLNPFDSCMMEGYGKNNIQYFFNGRYDFLNCPGGICNGITSGLEDEHGIAYVMEPCAEVNDNWRWAEQWIPHVSWFMLAQAAKKF
jgi:hypothetical protein